MFFNKQQQAVQKSTGNSNAGVWFTLALTTLYGIAGSLFFLPKRTMRPPGKKSNIELRYLTEKNADTTFLAQNLLKIIKIVLTPLEAKISKEDAKLIFVYDEDGWEMRVRNGSDQLRHSVRELLEAKEW